MKKILLTIIFSFSIVLSAQNYSHQVYVISNGGGLIAGEGYENFIITGEPIISITDLNGEDIYFGALGFFPEPDSFGVGIEYEDIISPKFSLRKNYPNPFNPETTISFYLPKKSKVCLEIFNIRGQKVTTLINEEIDAGLHSIIWNSTDKNNKHVSSGVYLYRMITESYEKIRKMILIK